MGKEWTQNGWCNKLYDADGVVCTVWYIATVHITIYHHLSPFHLYSIHIPIHLLYTLA